MNLSVWSPPQFSHYLKPFHWKVNPDALVSISPQFSPYPGAIFLRSPWWLLQLSGSLLPGPADPLETSEWADCSAFCPLSDLWVHRSGSCLADLSLLPDLQLFPGRLAPWLALSITATHCSPWPASLCGLLPFIGPIPYLPSTHKSTAPLPFRTIFNHPPWARAFVLFFCKI